MHADLMPELGMQIRMLRRIRGVDVDSDESFHHVAAAKFDDEDIRRFLQENLTKYTIQDAISRGGQGLVFRATQLSTHRDVAIKVLADGVFASKQQLERFMREIELAARLRHPNIVAIHDSGTVQNRPYCVMEYVDGEPVDDYVLLERPSLRDRVTLFAKICRAVSYAHQRGVIHRDLKPANILVDSEGEPRLLDFGLAKDAFAREASNAGLSMPGQVIGTLQFLTPEQIRGIPGEIDVRTDIYALGLVFYQVLTGTPPFPAKESYDDVRRQILEAPPTPFRALVSSQPGAPDPKDLDPDIEAILRKALEKDKDRRYQSADAMADDFERYLRDEIVVARADTRFYIFRKTVRRYRIQLAVAAGFVLLTTAAAIVSTSQYFRASRERDRFVQVAGVAQDVMNQLLTKIDDRVSRLPGGQVARDQIQSDLRPKLKALAQLLQSVGGMDRELAHVNLNLGKIAERRGDRVGAEKEYLAVMDAIAKSGETSAAMAALEIEAKIGLGAVVTDPVALLHEAIELATARAAEAPDEVIFKALWCEAEVQLARHLDMTGAYYEAATAADRALDVFHSAPSDSGYRPRLVLAAADAHEQGGGVRRLLGDCGDSRWHYQVASDLLGELLDRSPADVLTRLRRMRLDIRTSGLLQSMGATEEALRSLNRAISDGELLCQLDPSEFEWSLSLVHACLFKADIVGRDDPGAARETICDCQARLAVMSRATPGSIRIRYLQGLALMMEAQIDEGAREDGQAERDEGAATGESDPPAGSEDCDAAIISRLNAAAGVFASLESTDPGRTEAELQLADCFFSLAVVYRHQGRVDLARPLVEQCYELSLNQFAAQPDATSRWITLMEARFEALRFEIGVEGGAKAGLQREIADMLRVLSGLKSSPVYDCYRLRIDRLSDLSRRTIAYLASES
ncbi:MAG TPA: serine/threonine-protein kinase [Phycisphaerae bacterium]|nr:serine/threonine-protein kinase [Phycisphaerae bacterium]